MTHFVNSKELGNDLAAHLVDLTKSGADQIGGADDAFDCTGNVTSCARRGRLAIAFEVMNRGVPFASLVTF